MHFERTYQPDGALSQDFDDDLSLEAEHLDLEDAAVRACRVLRLTRRSLNWRDNLLSRHRCGRRPCVRLWRRQLAANQLRLRNAFAR